MREILFRGFHDDVNGSQKIQIEGRIIRGEWVYGGIWINETISRLTYHITTPDGDIISVIPETVGQYTGLTDKNGHKGFIGDKIIDEYRSKSNQYGIIKYDNYNQFIIEWNFRSTFEGKEYDGKNELPMRKLEDHLIIGTIFDVEVEHENKN